MDTIEGEISVAIEQTRARPVPDAVALSEIESQLDAAHKYPRSIKRFLKEAEVLATLNTTVAESCIYALPRSGKTVAGPSVRLAEICASSYGNMHVASRVVAAEAREILAQGAAWDLEKNLRVTVDVRRRITGKNGARFNDDMIAVTGAAAGSIALRNAIFRVIPRSYVDLLYGKARDFAVGGNASTFAKRREDVVVRLQKIGVPLERICVRVGRSSVDEVDAEALEILIGLGTAIKDKSMSIDEAFPPVDSATSNAKDIEEELRNVAPASVDKPAGAAKAKPSKKAEPPPPPDLPEIDPETGEIVPPPNAGDAWEPES